MTPGRPEVADPAALPRVLADPPWLGERVRVTLPEITGLDPLPLPDREVWPDGLRRRLLSSGPGTSGSEGPGSPQDALAQLVDSPHGSAPKLAAAQRRIREAAADGDGAAVAAGLADLRRVEQQLSDSPRTLDAAAIVRLPGGIGADVWNALAWELIDDLDRPGFAAATLGLAGLAGITRVLQRRPAEYAGLALPFASVSLAPVVARCLRRVPPARRAARDWLLAHPEHAAAGLVGAALGFASDSQADALAGLRVLAEAGDRALVEQVGARYGRDDVTAGLTAVLDLDPLLELPSRIEPLPHWWAPGEWARPRLVDGRALPDQALDALGVMFALPREHGVYPGIGQAVAACDPASLAACGWDLFTAWLDDGADPQDGWAMSTLGLIGDDDTARRITPLLRSWTGRTQPRAVQGLDVLAGIGTDVALLQLNGIAQRARSAGLKEAAGERVALLAAGRQLTAQELQDRLVPDLGLDERGTLTLDFGPRRFTVGFDEALTPLVRDQDGARLKTLPKPRSGDDPALAKEAAASWRRLKKDARTVAAQQVVRFERAMTQRQRWTPQEFTELIVGHPLVGHVAHRLVWGLYSPGAEGRWRGGELVAAFRVAEDRTLVGADDEPVTLPAADVTVGVVHPLELTAPDAAALNRVFAEYEIAQPFPQLVRDTHTLTAEESAATDLTRWRTRPFPTARLLGMPDRGWWRGDPQDGGRVRAYHRDLGDGRWAQLDLDPGFPIGDPGAEPVQRGVTLVVGTPGWEGVEQKEPFGVLHPVTAGELVREAEFLTREVDA